MADRKMTVLNPAGYQEILQTADELIIDSNSVEFKANTEIGFFDSTPRAKYEATNQSLTNVIDQIRQALNAFGLTNITGNSDYNQDLADLLDYITNPISITGTSPITVSETDNTYTIGITDASTTARGSALLATTAQTITGTDAVRSVTPDSLDGALNENGADVGDAADDGFTIDCGVYDS